MRVFVVLLAAGAGTRLGAGIPKGFLQLKGKPLFLWALEAFEGIPEVQGGALVVPGGYEEKALGYLKNKAKAWKVVRGGERRQDSAFMGLVALGEQGPDYVMIHDAARPLVTRDLIRGLLGFAPQAVVPVLRPSDALLQAEGGWASAYLERDRAYLVQTPQGFPFRGILEAHRRAREEGIADAPDDAHLYLRLGHRVRLAEGDRRNLKVTYPEDLRVAEAILEALCR